MITKLNLQGKDQNLILELFDQKQIADLYYLASDNNLEIEQIEIKIKVSFVKLMNQWIDRIESLNLSETTYLPFDFSDQYIGCLKVSKLENDKLSLLYGYTRQFEGWQLPPSNIEKFILNENSFELDWENNTVNKEDLLNAIAVSISDVGLDNKYL